MKLANVFPKGSEFEDMKSKILEGVGSNKTLYLIYRGKGMDSGFGDYCSNWENSPVRLGVDILFFLEERDAKAFVEELNKESKNKFYSEGETRRIRW